jgi:hypothetical protein
MSSPPVLSNAAFMVLQQQRPPATARSAADSPVASINSVSSPARSGAGSRLTQEQAEISQSTFSVNSLNVTATKVRLMERAGKEFRIDQADYESVFS